MYTFANYECKSVIYNRNYSIYKIKSIISIHKFAYLNLSFYICNTKIYLKMSCFYGYR